MNRLYKFVAICSLAIICQTNPVLSAEFIDGLEDIPKIEEMIQIENETVSFGNEQARFVETYFLTQNTNFDKIANFYQQTLPQLGWKLIKQRNNFLQFRRDVEILEIAKENELTRITLKSKN